MSSLFRLKNYILKKINLSKTTSDVTMSERSLTGKKASYRIITADIGDPGHVDPVLTAVLRYPSRISRSVSSPGPPKIHLNRNGHRY